MAKTKKKTDWEAVMTQVENGEVAVFIAANGGVCIDGAAMMIPDRFLSRVPADVLTKANERRANVERQKEERNEAVRLRLKAEEAAKAARLDEPGFTLVAGENSTTVHSGTLRECRDNLWKVMSQPRDGYAGVGCWVIVDSTGTEIDAGRFDKSAWW